jgi:enamine deaminase RidA (YjgF/YER057c/UK114 family)
MPVFIGDGVHDRLARLGIELPQPTAPIGAYKRVTTHGGLCFLSGQLPIVDGRMIYPGRLGAELNIEQGRFAARQATINALAQIAVLTTCFLGFRGLVRLDGLIAATPDFGDHAKVLDASSELFMEVLGEKGAHARSVSGVASLPGAAAVELVITFAGALSEFGSL